MKATNRLHWSQVGYNNAKQTLPIASTKFQALLGKTLVPQRHLSDAELIRCLYIYGEMTVPHIAKVFRVDPKTASYHIEKLVQVGLVVKNEKSYGSKYMLKPELTNIPLKFYLQVALTYTPLIVGIILFLNTYYMASCFFLLMSSTLGLATTYHELIHYKKGRLKEVLALLEKRT